jgi:hypothetical protein
MDITGTCVYCEKDYKKAGISRHLHTHLKNIPAQQRSASYHLRVEAGNYFLNLLADGDLSLDELDDYLRAIWLECCGHLSEFGFERWAEPISQSTKVRRVFDKGTSLWYAYDFGSTTELIIRCLNKYPFPTKDGIDLLSRNNPLQYKCQVCKKKNATHICTAHWGEEAHIFCEKCSTLHEKNCSEAEYSLGPLYNSPRAGVCAYEGGQIDLERDSS